MSETGYETIIEIDNVSKEYRLGTIGGGTLQADLQSWWARVRGKDDPNREIGEKVYGKNEKFKALDGVSFNVNRGERVGIIGHNGAGKSTLLKLLSRVTAPTAGCIYLDGRISSMLEVGTGFHSELTGRQNIYLNGAILGMSKAEVDSKIEQIIAFSECEKFIDTPVKRYSSGMFVKLAFSVSAHLDCEIMVMDEVLAVGDMAFQQKCLNKMNEVSKQQGRTILYVSHNMNTIRQLCTRCVVLDHGKVIFNGDVEEAIGVYLNSSRKYDMNTSSYDLSEEHRDDEFAVNVKMNRLSYPGKEDNIFVCGDKVKIKLEWECLKDTKNVRFRTYLEFINGNPVGLALSEPITDAVAGEHYETVFEFDTSMLAQARYFLGLELYQSESSGGDWIVLDELERAACIRILNRVEDSNKIVWHHRKWGSVKFPELVITENTRK